MKKVIKPGRARKSINFIDNIVYSRQKDLEGNEMELKMSIMLQNGNSEMRLASGHDDEADDKTPKPAILWVPGGGYRGCDKNLMVADGIFSRCRIRGCFHVLPQQCRSTYALPDHRRKDCDPFPACPCR